MQLNNFIIKLNILKLLWSINKDKRIYSEARNLIRRIIRKCDEKPNKEELLHSLKKFDFCNLHYINISMKTILRIRKEDLTSKRNVIARKKNGQEMKIKNSTVPIKSK